MNLQQPRILLGVRETATALSISRGSVYNLVKEGVLPAPSKIGTRSVWSVGTVQAAADRIVRGEVRP